MIFRKFLIVAGNKFLAAYRAFLVAVSADGGVAEAQVYTNALLQTASNASIVQIPSAYKATVLYNQVPTPTGEDFTVARASDVTRTNEDGFLEVIGSNVPCIDYSDGFPVLLTQPQSTNLITYSEDFSNAAWTKAASVSIIPNFSISPSGNLDATQLTVTTVNQGILQNFTSLNSLYTATIYLKTATGTVDLQFGFFDGTTTQTDTITVTDTWTRFEVSKTLLAFGASRFWIYPGASGTKVVEVYGAQLEQLSYPTSYIPTSGATATRLGDVISGAGSTASINSEEGVLHLETAMLANDGLNKRVSISDGTGANYVDIIFSATANRVSFTFVENSVFFVSKNIDIADVTINHIYDFKWKLNDVEIFIDGVSVATDFSVTVPAANTFDRLNLDFYTTVTPLLARTKQLRVYSSIAAAQIDLPYIT